MARVMTRQVHGSMITRKAIDRLLGISMSEASKPRHHHLLRKAAEVTDHPMEMTMITVMTSTKKKKRRISEKKKKERKKRISRMTRRRHHSLSRSCHRNLLV